MTLNQEIFTAAKILGEIISKGVDRGIVAKPSLAIVNGKTVLLGVSQSKRLLLMIPAHETQVAGADESLTPTLTMKLMEQLDSQGQLQKFLALQTSSEFDVTLFGAICDQAIIELKDGVDPRILLRSIVNYWRKLLDSMNVESLSKSKAIGLFGELIFLKALQAQCGDRALTSWVGPEGARYDFQFNSAAVEVKTTTRTDSLIAEVHGIDQFEEITEKTSWLAFAQIEWDPHGVSLAELISSIRDLFIDKSTFDAKLKLMGIKEGGKNNSSFIFTQQQLYLDIVTDEFPFLNTQAISDSIDIGRLRGIGYAVSLDGLCTPIGGDELLKVLDKICQ
jgi:hypothetical protein